MSHTIDIDRLSIALHGVSANVAEAALSGLGAELKRRLGNVSERALITGDFGMLRMDGISGTAVLDPAALRGLIAERLILALTQAAPSADVEDQ